MKLDSDNVAQWLEGLVEDRLVTLNPRVMLDIDRLLGRLKERNVQDPAVVGCSLASLLATNQEQWQQIVEHFQRFFDVSFPYSGKPSEGVVIQGAPPSKRPDSQSGGKTKPKFKPWLLLKRARLPILLLLAPFFGICLSYFVWVSLGRPTYSPPTAQALVFTMGKMSLSNDRTQAPKLPAVQFVLVQDRREHFISRSPDTFLQLPSLPAPSLGLNGFALLSLFLSAIGIRFFFANRQFEADVNESNAKAKRKRAELEEKIGEQGVKYHFLKVPPLPIPVLDDVATLLGRLTRREEGNELDVRATVDGTAEAGGRVVPIYERGRRPDALLVLVDTEGRGRHTGHPYLSGVEMALEHWHRLGVPMIRYNFSYDPLLVFRHEDRRRVSLEELGRLHEDTPLLIFSRMIQPEGYTEELNWLSTYFAGPRRAWPYLGWIDLDPRAPAERTRDQRERLLQRIGTYWPRYPFTKEGLIVCATSLTSREQKRTRAKETPLPANDEDILRALRIWAAAAVCVPDPEWAHLDSLRVELPEVRDMLPEHRHVQLLLDYVLAMRYYKVEPGRGPYLKLNDTAKTELLRWLREEDAGKGENGVEYRTRMLLIQQMRAARKGKDAYEEMRRAMKIAFHEAVLGMKAVNELLKEYGESPVGPELKQMLDAEIELQKASGLSLLREKKWELKWLEVLTKGGTGVRPEDLRTLRRWTGGDLMGALVMGVVLFGGWGASWLWRAESGQTVIMPEIRKALPPPPYEPPPPPPPPTGTTPQQCKGIGDKCHAGKDCCSNNCPPEIGHCTVCRGNQSSCLNHEDCCSSKCLLGKCVNYCIEDGAPCKDNYECCSGVCTDEVCGRCKVTGKSCSRNDECCKKNCSNGMCTFCRTDSEACTSSNECCSNLGCEFGICRACRRVGDPCERSEECCWSSECVQGKCV